MPLNPRRVNLSFYVGKQLPHKVPRPAALLIPQDWDDYGYRTQFRLEVHLRGDPLPVPVGEVKILARDAQADDGGHRYSYSALPSRFEKLDPSAFCSLGQSANYYATLGKRALAQEASNQWRGIPKALNDICLSDEQSTNWWTSHPGYVTSLLRFNDANIALRKGRKLLEGKESEADMVHRIALNDAMAMQFHSIVPSGIEFRFDGTLDVPGRVNVLVGKNGTGKTSLLEALAVGLTRERPPDKFSYTPPFSRVVFVSHNSFDAFKLLGRVSEQSKTLEFVGFRPQDRALAARIRKIVVESDDASWLQSVQAILPDRSSFLSILPGLASDAEDDMEALRGNDGWQVFVPQAFDQDDLASLILDRPSEALRMMSAGQRALVSIYAGLYQRLDRQSLVLIDEPENYLHPSLVARLIRNLNLLLNDRRAYAIVSTHSPVIVQETPRRFVWIADRSGDDTQLQNPDFETFGESVDNIDEFLFDTDFRSSHWKQVLEALAKKGLSNEEIGHHIGNKEIPLLARTYLERARLKAIDNG